MSSTARTTPAYLLAGTRLILRPELRRFVVAPLLINTLLFIGMLLLALAYFNQLLAQLFAALPTWLGVLEWLLWPLFVLLLLFIFYFTFSLLNNLIAAPFNGFLSEKVACLVSNSEVAPAFTWQSVLTLIPSTLKRELHKLSYFLPRAVVLLVLSLIPGINLLAAPLWLLFGAWMTAVQYIDYPADNAQYNWQQMLAWLHQRRIQSLSFGICSYMGLLIPLVNLLVMPAAVAGATLFWLDVQKGAATAPQKTDSVF